MFLSSFLVLLVSSRIAVKGSPTLNRALTHVQDRAGISIPENAIYLDDLDPRIIWSGPYSTFTNSSCHSGTCRSLEGQDSSLEFSFQGTDIWLYGTSGLGQIYVDDKPSPLLIEPSQVDSNGQLLWFSSQLKDENHSIRITGTDKAGSNLKIDYFRLLGSMPPLDSGSGKGARSLVIALIVGAVIAFIAILISIGIWLYRINQRVYIKSERIPMSESGRNSPNSTTKFTIDIDGAPPTAASFASTVFERQQEALWRVPSPTLEEHPNRFSVVATSYIPPRELNDTPTPASLFYHDSLRRSLVPAPGEVDYNTRDLRIHRVSEEEILR